MTKTSQKFHWGRWGRKGDNFYPYVTPGEQDRVEIGEVPFDIDNSCTGR